MNTLTQGQTNQYVVQLQQFLNMRGYFQPITGFFGPQTKANLMKYQKDHGIQPTGIADGAFVGVVTKQDKLDLWCHAIQDREGYFAPGENPTYPNGTPAWANNNPGNCVFVNQDHSVKNGRFAKFTTYQDGYNYLKDLLIWACTGQAKPLYNPDMTLVQFYQVYAPSSDGNDPSSYANQVATKLGVTSDTAIKNLLV